MVITYLISNQNMCSVRYQVFVVHSLPNSQAYLQRSEYKVVLISWEQETHGKRTEVKEGQSPF